MFICIYHSIYTTCILFGWCAANSLRARGDPMTLVGDLTALRRRPRGHSTLISTAFVFSMPKVRAVLCDLTAFTGDATALLAFPRRAGRRSGFF